MSCKTIEELVERIRSVDKQYDIDKIMQAYTLANDAHKGQVRSSGDPYISHPIAVASILVDYCMDTDTIVSALLHELRDSEKADGCDRIYTHGELEMESMRRKMASSPTRRTEMETFL